MKAFEALWKCYIWTNFGFSKRLSGSASKELKAKKLEEILNKQYTELENRKEAAPANDKQIVGQFLRPVMESINTALDTFQHEMQPVIR